MLDELEASKIVVACIRAVSHVNSVDEAGKLDDADIFDSTRVTNMVTKIVNDEEIGVPSKNHRIGDSWFLGVDPSTPVFDVIDIVMDKSVPVSENLMEDLAMTAAKPRAVRKSRSATKTTKKSTKKSSKGTRKKRE